MGYIHQIIQAEPQPAVWIKKATSINKLPNEIRAAYGEVISYLNEIGEPPLGPAFIAYYNMDTENLVIEIGFPVTREVPGRGDLVYGLIPGGKIASSFYKGAYNGMGACYEEILKWITDKGYVPSGVVYEFYYNSPMDVPESELLTEIRFLLR